MNLVTTGGEKEKMEEISEDVWHRKEEAAGHGDGIEWLKREKGKTEDAKVRLYDAHTGTFWGSRVVYHGVVNELGDQDEYYLDRHGEIRLLAIEGLEVTPLDRHKIIRR